MSGSTDQSTTTPSPVNCVRKDCIADPRDPYHQEAHLCFVCGEQWYVTPELVRDNLCTLCNWVECPVCGGCKCSLSPEREAWVDHVRKTYCQSVEVLAAFRVRHLPPVSGPAREALLLHRGLTLQLMFCNRWARCELQRREEARIPF